MSNPALEGRIDMSLDDILSRNQGGGRSPRGRGRRFAHGGPKPYDRNERTFDDAPVHKSQGPPPPVDLNSVTNRLYVNNLSYNTSWQDLKDHMRTAGGNVLHTEIFSDHLGRSKGCGIVEFETRQDAIRALKQLNDSELQGRLIYLREDREETAPAPVVRRSRGGFSGHDNRFERNDRGDRFDRGDRNDRNDRFDRGDRFDRNERQERPHFSRPSNAPLPGAGGAGCQVFVHNLPYTTSWQDLKDQFRTCGNVIRADVLYGPDGRPKGTGVILFESAADARRAINQMDEVSFNGRVIYVREDKFEGLA